MLVKEIVSEYSFGSFITNSTTMTSISSYATLLISKWSTEETRKCLISWKMSAHHVLSLSGIAVFLTVKWRVCTISSLKLLLPSIQVTRACFSHKQLVSIPNLEYCLCGVLHFLLLYMWIFSGFSGFLQPSNTMQEDELTNLNCL